MAKWNEIKAGMSVKVNGIEIKISQIRRDPMFGTVEIKGETDKVENEIMSLPADTEFEIIEVAQMSEEAPKPQPVMIGYNSETGNPIFRRASEVSTSDVAPGKKYERDEANEIAAKRAQWYYDNAIENGESEAKAQVIFDEWVEEFQDELMSGEYDPTEYQLPVQA